MEWVKSSLRANQDHQIPTDMFKLILMSLIHPHVNHVTRSSWHTNQKGQSSGDMYSGEPLEDGWTELWDQTHSFRPV